MTKKHYCTRLRELFDHSETCTEDALHLPKHGRHFRIRPHVNIVAGRDQGDNDAILRHYDPDRDTRM